MTLSVGDGKRLSDWHRYALRIDIIDKQPYPPDSVASSSKVLRHFYGSETSMKA